MMLEEVHPLSTHKRAEEEERGRKRVPSREEKFEQHFCITMDEVPLFDGEGYIYMERLRGENVEDGDYQESRGLVVKSVIPTTTMTRWEVEGDSGSDCTLGDIHNQSPSATFVKTYRKHRYGVPTPAGFNYGFILFEGHHPTSRNPYIYTSLPRQPHFHTMETHSLTALASWSGSPYHTHMVPTAGAMDYGLWPFLEEYECRPYLRSF